MNLILIALAFLLLIALIAGKKSRVRKQLKKNSDTTGVKFYKNARADLKEQKGIESESEIHAPSKKIIQENKNGSQRQDFQMNTQRENERRRQLQERMNREQQRLLQERLNREQQRRQQEQQQRLQQQLMQQQQRQQQQERQRAQDQMNRMRK